MTWLLAFVSEELDAFPTDAAGNFDVTFPGSGLELRIVGGGALASVFRGIWLGDETVATFATVAETKGEETRADAALPASGSENVRTEIAGTKLALGKTFALSRAVRGVACDFPPFPFAMAEPLELAVLPLAASPSLEIIGAVAVRPTDADRLAAKVARNSTGTGVVPAPCNSATFGRSIAAEAPCASVAGTLT